MNNDDNIDYTELSSNVAKALEARVYLYMNHNQEALNDVKDLLERYSLTTDADTYKAMWKDDVAPVGQELIYEPQMTADDRASFYGAFEAYSDANHVWNPDYLPTQGLIDLYNEDDIRQMTFFRAEEEDGSPVVIIGGDNQAEGVVLSKFPGNDALKKANDGTVFYNMPKPFRVAELYLIGAEAS